jgi:hypothetical protein
VTGNDLRTLAAEALAANLDRWLAARRADWPALADAVLAAVLPAHRAQVLDEAARMIQAHADKHFPADGNDAQRRGHRHLRIAVQVVSPKPTREQIAEALVEMGILKRAATGPETTPGPRHKPDGGPAVPEAGQTGPDAHSGSQGDEETRHD